MDKQRAKINRVSFSLEDQYQELFKKITRVTRRSMTHELRVMLDERAIKLGFEPVAPLDYKAMHQ